VLHNLPTQFSCSTGLKYPRFCKGSRGESALGYVSWEPYKDELCASFTSRFILRNEEEQEITGKVAMLPAVIYKELPRQGSREENLCTMDRLHMMGAVCDSYTCVHVRKKPHRIVT
jgi:hypothetical protein